MSKQIGRIFRDAVDDKITKPALAKKIGISESYVRHILYGSPVRISDRVFEKLCRVLSLPKTKLKPLQIAQNRRSSLWYAKYRKRRAKAA